MQAYQRRRDFLVEVFGIADYMRTPARKLSLGERMRCELAAALLEDIWWAIGDRSCDR